MKKYLAIVIVFCSILMFGCENTKDKEQSDLFMQQYLLHDNEQYNDYLAKKQLNEGMINEEGFYTDSEIDDAELDIPSGMVHVSFAHHSLMTVTYYLDSAMLEKIDENNCFLNPGDTIFAKIDTTNLVQSNTYEFHGFRLAAFDGTQSNYNYAFFEGEKITIPDDIQYSEISIIPEGKYKKRNLSFDTEFSDPALKALGLSPVWIVVTGPQSVSTVFDSYSLEANSTFRVKAEFNSSKYYLIEDEVSPEYESYDEKEGIVTFKQYAASNAIDNYSIKLGPKFEFEIEKLSADGEVKVRIDDQEPFDYKDHDQRFIGSAKEGAVVRIEGAIHDIGAVKNLTRTNNQAYEYVVGKGSGKLIFDPENYSYSHGKVVFYDAEHNIILSKTELTIGDRIYLTGKPDEGYSFNKGDGKVPITVDSDIEYLLNNMLSFEKQWKLLLRQPDKGGTIVYYLNGKEVKTKEVTMSEETDKLTANFQAEAGFKAKNLSDGAECKVTDEDHNIRFIDNNGGEIPVDKVFEPSEAQKASLMVRLDDSVGEEAKFNIYNGNDTAINDKKCYVKKSMFEKTESSQSASEKMKTILGFDENVLLENEPIDTTNELKIAVSDWSLIKNEALRIDVEKTDVSQKKTIEVYYITSGSGSQMIDTAVGDQSIEIKISKVYGTVFNVKEFVYENGTVIISYDDVTDHSEIKDGDFVDDSRKIKIVLTADEGYQLKQKSVNPFSKSYNVVDQYVTACKYEKLKEKFSEMKKKTIIEH